METRTNFSVTQDDHFGVRSEASVRASRRGMQWHISYAIEASEHI